MKNYTTLSTCTFRLHKLFDSDIDHISIVVSEANAI